MIYLTTLSTHGQDTTFNYAPEGYVCYTANGALTVDGRLDEADWAKAPWTNEFVDIEGDLRSRPLYKTRIKMLWDSEYFYVAAELEEPHIWATYDKRDMVIFHENDFEVFIDPDGDTHNYYEIEINALGTVWDLMLIKPYRDGGPPIDGWDITGLKKGIFIDGTLNNPTDLDNKWSLEMAFPWYILEEAAAEGRKPRDGEQWRVNFSRVNWQTESKDGKYIKTINPETGKPYPEYNWVWSPQGVINMHRPETWGFVQFSEKRVGTGKIQFVSDVDDPAKWFLRNLYYAQIEFLELNGFLTNNINQLEIKGDLKKWINPGLKIDVTSTLFEISYPGNRDGHIWHVREDGRLWKTINKLPNKE